MKKLMKDEEFHKFYCKNSRYTRIYNFGKVFFKVSTSNKSIKATLAYCLEYAQFSKTDQAPLCDVEFVLMPFKESYLPKEIFIIFDKISAWILRVPDYIFFPILFYEGEEVFSPYSDISIQMPIDKRNLYLATNSSISYVDFTEGKIFGLIKLDRKYFLGQYIFNMLDFYLKYKDSILLHAGCLVKDDKGILFLGKSGCGKTTITIALVKKGLNYVSDDSCYLYQYQRGGKIWIMSYKTGLIKINDYWIKTFPDLFNLKRSRVVTIPGLGNYVNFYELFPNRYRRFCSPTCLIFPKFVSKEKSEINLIHPARAFERIISNASISLDRTENKLQIFKELIKSCRCYDMSIGRDIKLTPGKISDFILSIL
jgi:hypothetical protein